MKTLLAFRPLNIRMKVAYLCTAKHPGAFSQEINPMDSISRLLNENDAYHRMWEVIGHFYDKQGMGQYSDNKILAKYQECLTGKDGKLVAQAVDLWESRGWAEYERRRNGRHSVANRAAFLVPTGIAACFGVFLPQP